MMFGKVGLLCIFLPFSLLFSGCGEDNVSHTSTSVTPKTMHAIEVINSSTPLRLIDLTNIVIALERFKIDNRHYPISSRGAEEWDTFVDEQGNEDPYWIKGLVPAYLDTLPIDPRKSINREYQYAYKSDGAHYKLMALHPEDCSVVKKLSPFRIDPMRDCTAYGYWTHGALRW